MANIKEDEFELTLTGSSSRHVRNARRFVADAIEGRVTQRMSQAIQLATSELVTNALEYGTGGIITIGVMIGSDEARICVTNEIAEGHQLPSREHWTIPANPAQTSGRGLGIVNALSSDMQFRLDGQWTSVIATFGLRQ